MADLTTIEHWREWRERCAITKCGAKTAGALRSYAKRRFTFFLLRLADDEAFDLEVPDADDCWRLLETFLCVARPRSGRRYKEWLFARLARSSDDPLDIIQGGATLVLRTVVRDWFAAHRPPRTFSLNAPILPGGVSLAELLPDPSSPDRDDWEIRDAAAATARSVATRLSPATRLVLAVRAWGLPLFHPAVLRYIGIGHTKAAETPKAVLGDLAGHVRRNWSREPSSWQMRVCLAAYHDLVALVMSRWDSDRAHSHLNRLLKHHPQEKN